MNRTQKAADFYDPDTGGQPLRFRRATFSGSHEPRRSNYFTIYRVVSGSGVAEIDEVHAPFAPTALLFVVPYQYVRLTAPGEVSVEAIEFHANFLCIETFHAEAGCAGRLFNDPYGLPIVQPGEPANTGVRDLFRQIERELNEAQLAYRDAALALLKLLLIRLSRLKETPAAGATTSPVAEESHRHPVLVELETLVEARYRLWHAPSDYAKALHTPAKTLGRLVREHLGTTPTDLIRRRILTHAKWQLLHTLKSVKEIAAELGYDDELYFSRFFKKATGISPTYFRDFETMIRRGSNLSMTMGDASMAGGPAPLVGSGTVKPADGSRRPRRPRGSELPT